MPLRKTSGRFRNQRGMRRNAHNAANAKNYRSTGNKNKELNPVGKDKYLNKKNSDGQEDGGQDECPLCLEELTMTDLTFKPCPCGYQICLWCFNKIRVETEKARCPNCRRVYDAEQIQNLSHDSELEKIEKERLKNKKSSKHRYSRKALTNVRVIQRNLVYVVGLTTDVAKESFLGSKENFGKFGKISKLVINKSNLTRNSQSMRRDPTVSAYITYQNNEDAARAIAAVDGTWIDGKMLRASYGTTKYCAYFLRNVACTNPDCMYLHKFGTEEDTFNKDDIVLKNGLPMPQTRSGRPDPYANLQKYSSEGKHIWNFRNSNFPPAKSEEDEDEEEVQDEYWDADENSGDGSQYEAYESYDNADYDWDDKEEEEVEPEPRKPVFVKPQVIQKKKDDIKTSIAPPAKPLKKEKTEKESLLPSTARWGKKARHKRSLHPQKEESTNSQKSSPSWNTQNSVVQHSIPQNSMLRDPVTHKTNEDVVGLASLNEGSKVISAPQTLFTSGPNFPQTQPIPQTQSGQHFGTPPYPTNVPSQQQFGGISNLFPTFKGNWDPHPMYPQNPQTSNSHHPSHGQSQTNSGSRFAGFFSNPEYHDHSMKTLRDLLPSVRVRFAQTQQDFTQTQQDFVPQSNPQSQDLFSQRTANFHSTEGWSNGWGQPHTQQYNNNHGKK